MRKLLISINLFCFIFAYISSDATGKNGVVVSSKIPASQIGIDVLKKGGNAIDAAVAVAFALSVTHPSAGNLGGGGFAVIRFSDGKSTTIDFREVAPKASSSTMFLDDKGNVIEGLSKFSGLSSGVPGTVSGLGYMHSKYGTLDWDELILPSIMLARYGFNLDAHNVSILNNPSLKNKLSVCNNSKKIFVKADDFEVNELFIQKDLSKTLQRLSIFGHEEFYNGITADNILETIKSNNGIISHEDLRNYKPIEASPIIFDYKGFNVISMPPSSSGGLTLALILNQFENLDLSSILFHDASHVHYLSEVGRRAYVDRHKYLGDMSFINIPIDKLLSQNYADSLFNSISDSFATNSSDLYSSDIVIDSESTETTHISIIDSFGNCVSLTTTLNGWFGNGITVKDSGFLLNNEMDDFSIKPGHPNMYGLIGSEANNIQPGKRMLSSMTPTIVVNSNNEPYLVLGSPGGSTIITTIAQIIINSIDFKMEIKDAVESKRFHHQWVPDFIQLEKHSLSSEVINKLVNMNHNYIYRSDIGIGEANCIMVKNNTFHGSSDSRRGSSALAY